MSYSASDVTARSRVHWMAVAPFAAMSESTEAGATLTGLPPWE